MEEGADVGGVSMGVGVRIGIEADEGGGSVDPKEVNGEEEKAGGVIVNEVCCRLVAAESDVDRWTKVGDVPGLPWGPAVLEASVEPALKSRVPPPSAVTESVCVPDLKPSRLNTCFLSDPPLNCPTF